MRKAQKKMALEHVRTQYQAHDQIRNLIEEQNEDAAMDLLGLCQQGAIELGNLIEQTEGEDSPVIRLLEMYCEEVYRIYEGIRENMDGVNVINGKHVYNMLQKWLIQIENSIKNDITERIEVVFLPYKASMWILWKACGRRRLTMRTATPM